MSLPVTRRIARAALLVAAGAAPVVAAAGSASALNLPPNGTEVGGLTTLDSANTSKNVDKAAQTGTSVVNEASGQASRTLAPAVAGTVAPVVAKTAPITQGTAHKAKGVVHPVADKAKRVTKEGVSGDTLPEEAIAAVAQQGAPGLLGGVAMLLGGVPVYGPVYGPAHAPGHGPVVHGR